MSLEGVRWTWRCSECAALTTTAPYGDPGECPQCGGRAVRSCEVCFEDITGRRADAETCGGPCRAEKSRRSDPSRARAQAHTGAPAKRAAPRRRPRAPENGVRVYFLGDELDDAVGRYRTVAVGTAAERAAAKLHAARARLTARASRRAS